MDERKERADEIRDLAISIKELNREIKEKEANLAVYKKKLESMLGEDNITDVEFPKVSLKMTYIFPYDSVILDTSSWKADDAEGYERIRAKYNKTKHTDGYWKYNWR